MAVLPSCFLAKVYFFIYNNESSKAGEGKLMGSIQKPVNLWPLWPWAGFVASATNPENPAKT